MIKEALSLAQSYPLRKSTPLKYCTAESTNIKITERKIVDRKTFNLFLLLITSTSMKYIIRNFSSFPKNALKDSPKLVLKTTDKALIAINIPRALFNPVLGSKPKKALPLYPNTLFNKKMKIAGQTKLSIPALENGRQKIERHRKTTIVRSRNIKTSSFFIVI